MNKKTSVIICGPTAVGKTSFAINIARYYKTKIISADSRQCYKELNIGVAKPTVEDLATIPHYFINSHSIHNDVNAGVFEQYALKAASEIFEENDIAVMVGGTGLYINSFANGIDEIPATEESIRTELNSKYQQKGLLWLQQQVQQHDPLFWPTAEQQNPHRLLRALEIKLSTGRSITEYRTGKKVERPFNIIKIGLELPKDQLYKNINERVDAMIEQGLLDEVKSLIPFKDIKALQTVGYKELFEFLEDKTNIANAIEKIKINTRHYAKRQMTWFKKDASIKWMHPAQSFKL